MGLLEDQYIAQALLFRAMSDSKRLMIVRMLSKGELCACKILEKFDITQPTLSHHMKVLCGCGLVSVRKEGKWVYYSLNRDAYDGLNVFLSGITSAEKSAGN